MRQEDKPSNSLPVTVFSLDNNTIQIDGIGTQDTLLKQDHQMWFSTNTIKIKGNMQVLDNAFRTQ
jgi:hypothetical protein